MRFILAMVLLVAAMFLLLGCAHEQPPPPPKPNPCPDVPKITDRETVKDYTLRLIEQYKACKAGKE